MFSFKFDSHRNWFRRMLDRRSTAQTIRNIDELNRRRLTSSLTPLEIRDGAGNVAGGLFLAVAGGVLLDPILVDFPGLFGSLISAERHGDASATPNTNIDVITPSIPIEPHAYVTAEEPWRSSDVSYGYTRSDDRENVGIATNSDDEEDLLQIDLDRDQTEEPGYLPDVSLSHGENSDSNSPLGGAAPQPSGAGDGGGTFWGGSSSSGHSPLGGPQPAAPLGPGGSAPSLPPSGGPGESLGPGGPEGPQGPGGPEGGEPGDVTIIAQPETLIEGQSGVFQIAKTNIAPPRSVTVFYSVAGTADSETDYTSSLSTYATIPADQSSIDISISALTDNVADSGETVVVTLTSVMGGQYQIGTPYIATVTIQDNSNGGNSPPEFSDTNDPDHYQFTVDASASNGTLIGTISATDPDNDVLSYSIQSDAIFANSQTGELRILDNMLLPEFGQVTYPISVSDGKGGSDTVRVLQIACRPCKNGRLWSNFW